MKDEGVITLQNAKQDMILKITGRAPVGAVPATMKIFLNGELLPEGEFPASEKMFSKEYNVAAAKLANGASSVLKITTTKFIIPSQIDKKLKDDRRLGFKLHTLTWLTVAGAPGDPALEPGPEPAVKEEAAPPSKGWLAAVLLLALALTLSGAAGLGIWLYVRQRSRSA